MPRQWVYECRDCNHRVAVPFAPEYLTWLAWQRVRLHKFRHWLARSLRR